MARQPQQWGVEKTETGYFPKEDGAWKVDIIPELEAKGLEAIRN